MEIGREAEGKIEKERERERVSERRERKLELLLRAQLIDRPDVEGGRGVAPLLHTHLGDLSSSSAAGGGLGSFEIFRGLKPA